MSVSFPESKKIAAVTGSRRGIGLAIARELGRAGYFVLVSGTRSREDSLSILESLKQEGITCEYIPCDISKEEDRRRFFDTVSE